jgi:hypothetical protein
MFLWRKQKNPQKMKKKNVLLLATRERETGSQLMLSIHREGRIDIFGRPLLLSSPHQEFLQLASVQRRHRFAPVFFPPLPGPISFIVVIYSRGKKNTKNKTVIDFKKQIELGHQNSTAAFWPVAAASVL